MWDLVCSKNQWKATPSAGKTLILLHTCIVYAEQHTPMRSYDPPKHKDPACFIFSMKRYWVFTHVCVCVCLSCFCLFATRMHVWMSLTWYAGLVWEALDVLQGCFLVNNCLITWRDSIHFHQHNACLVSAGRRRIQWLTVFHILLQYWRKQRLKNANRSAKVQTLAYVE